MKALVCLMAALLMASLLAAQAAEQREIQISREVAEKLLIHKAAPKCVGSSARVIGTVVIGLDIGIHGDVLHPAVITGPSLLHQAALDAVRQYKYRPYMLKGKPLQVETTVSVPFTLSDRCP